MAVPSARTRLSGPSGVATELMNTGTIGGVRSPKRVSSGCTVPWSTSIAAESDTSTPASHAAVAIAVAMSAATSSGPDRVP